MSLKPLHEINQEVNGNGKVHTVHYPRNPKCLCLSCNAARNQDNGRCLHYYPEELYGPSHKMTLQQKKFILCDGIIDIDIDRLRCPKHHFMLKGYQCDCDYCMERKKKSRDYQDREEAVNKEIDKQIEEIENYEETDDLPF